MSLTTPVAFLTLVYYNQLKANINRQFDFFCQLSHILSSLCWIINNFPDD
ncbi:hypothetical protein HMPREF0373_00953 [Eubacterium ramulus ATCC 29099]|uniref:Uncharacterized protein n=1 Tax=Eubacterium ramulus ATCC 29099 TaxID=1256908 RepID=U2RGI0_EUBRA|nr:hypothetical protein HMPREF0373_00953 [Eubacterium ramulus ATCC 29099]